MTRKTYKESVSEREYNRVVSKVPGNRFFDLLREHMVEAQLDSSDAGMVEWMFEQVWEKAEPFLSREIAHQIKADHVKVKIPIPSAATAGALSSNTFPTTGEAYTFTTLSVGTEVGINSYWTRAFLEEANWDVVSRQSTEGGRALDEHMMAAIVTAMEAQAVTAQPGGATVTMDGTISWKNVVDAIALVEASDFHVDKVLVSPAIYGELLNNDNFISAAIVGSDAAIRSGIIPTMLGVSFIRSSKCTAKRAYFIDSSAFMALGILREIQIEPFENPMENLYGLITSCRYGVQIVQPLACLRIQRA